MPIPDNQCNVVEVQMQGVVTSAGGTTHNVNNVYYFQRATNVNPISEINVEAAFHATNEVPILAALNNRYTQTQTVVRFIDDADRQGVSVARAGVGGVAGDSMPQENQVFCLNRTRLRGKTYRGGKRYWPLSESDTTAPTTDILNAAGLARMQAIGASLLSVMGDSDGNNWTFVLFSKRGSWLRTNPTTVVVNTITQFAVNKRITTNKKHKILSVY
jgi:hypothetical protein